MKPSPEFLAINRQAFGEIYLMEGPKSVYVFRPLTFDEIDTLLAHKELSTMDAEDLVVRFGVIWPEDFDPEFEKPGIVSNLAEGILNNSHIHDAAKAQEVLDEKRFDATQARHAMKAIVLACYDSLRLTDADLDQMTFTQLCSKVALAELIMDVKKSINTPGYELSFDILPDTPEQVQAPEDYDPVAEKLRQAMGK